GDRLGEMFALNTLALAYISQGEMYRAIEFLEQQLTITREIGDRRGAGAALFNISVALDEFSDRAKAIAHAEAALEIFEPIKSPYAEMVRRWLTALRGEATKGD